MNTAAIEPIPKSLAGSLTRSNRSPVLGQFRTIPLRVLRLQPDVSVDEAIWQAEAALTRLRAGLPSPEPDLLPWLPEPDEPEIRQAVQRIEEPLHRLADALFWFDLAHDPDGDLLRRALAELDPALLNNYLDLGDCDGLPRRPVASIKPDGVFAVSPGSVAAISGESSPSPDGTPPPEDVPEIAATQMPRLLNQANLRLLLGAMSLYGLLPDGVHGAGMEIEDSGKADAIEWSSWHGLECCQNAHQHGLCHDRQALRNRNTVALWSDSLARWMRLAEFPAFLEFVNQNIARLDDDVVGPDDTEAIVTSATTRLLDLLVGEVKAQLLSGRIDCVGALLEVARRSDVEPRRWTMAFRQLRPLIRNEVAELDSFVPGHDDPRFDDAALYLARLGTICKRWQSLDPSGFLGLAEIGDEAVAKVCDWLSHMECYAAVDRLKNLYLEAIELASAESLKQRIATTVGRLNGFDQYVCYFCRQREMDLKRSIVITGKRESHRTYGYNSTTIHYVIDANIIPRCARCSELHHYLWDVSGTVRSALGVAIAACAGLVVWTKPLGDSTDLGIYLIPAAIGALLIWAPAYLARWAVAYLVTPRGERKYWRAKTAKPYREMASRGSTITLDYRRDAFELFKKAQEQRAS
jgi:hypothetical protein